MLQVLRSESGPQLKIAMTTATSAVEGRPETADMQPNRRE
jgi:hypothetical protein